MYILRYIQYAFCFFLIACTSSKRKDKGDSSTFFFLPNNISELKENGYEQDKIGFYRKMIGDTMDEIRFINPDAEQFRKTLVFPRRTDTLTFDIIDSIAARADSVIFKLHPYLLVKEQGNSYLIHCGVRGYRFTHHSITYLTLKTMEDKIEAVDDLKKSLSFYPDSFKVSVHRALDYISPNWRSFPPYKQEGWDKTIQTVPAKSQLDTTQSVAH